MKYVTLRRMAFRFPVIFPDAIEHAQFAGADVVSAGFFSIGDDGSVDTFGRAVSLQGLTPKPGDDVLIGLLINAKEALLPLASTC